MMLDTKQGTLLVVDPAQDHKVLQTIPIGARPDKIRVDGANTVVVSCAAEPKIVMLTFAADRAQPPARQEFTIGANGGDHRDVSIGGGWIVAPNPGDNNVSLIPIATGTAQAVTAGNFPGPVGIGMSGPTAVAAIVGNVASNTVSLFALPGV
jgi:DNA-binding beta-propeller fold protein YncE